MGCRFDTQPHVVENDIVCLQNGTVFEAMSSTLQSETAEEVALFGISVAAVVTLVFTVLDINNIFLLTTF